MPEPYTVHLIGGAVDDETAILTPSNFGDSCRIEFRYREKLIEKTATDYFEAFCQIRLHLEIEKLIPFCYGASLNVYPSGMSRSMGEGILAYKLTMGKQALKKDLVRIFDEGPDVIPSSVTNQKKTF